MAVSKRLRYEVLRRDNHACRYCGAKAPDVKLTVDAVVPDALGGSHKDPANLVTACESCNGGKTSSSPDAPLVAQVADDALRWSQAMAAAAGEMLAKASGDIDACAHFEKVWNRYGGGPQREPIPKEPGWQNTVDNLLRSGLPMTVLEECIEIAMSQRRVPAENVFRYMCGVAWRKVQELRERASEMVHASPVDDEDGADQDDAEADVLDNWCRVILGQQDSREVEKATHDCLDYSGNEGPTGVLWFIIHNLQMDRAQLYGTLRLLMEALPDEVGSDLIHEHEAQRPNSSRYITLGWAAGDAADRVELVRARRELRAMPPGEREAWIQRAREENAEIAEHLDEDFYITEGARIARKAAAPQPAEAAV